MAVTNPRDEILQRYDHLPKSARLRLLEFARALDQSEPKGMSGREFAERFAGILDAQTLKEMTDAIEDGCERVDPNKW